MPENPIPADATRLTVLQNFAEQIDLRLCTNAPVLDADTVLASFTEAVFPGYIPGKAEEWESSSDPTQPDSIIRSANFVFLATAALPGQIIRGWFATVTFPDGSIRLLAAHILEQPVTMEAAKAGLSLDVAIKAFEV